MEGVKAVIQSTDINLLGVVWSISRTTVFEGVALADLLETRAGCVWTQVHTLRSGFFNSGVILTPGFLHVKPRAAIWPFNLI